MVPFWGAGQGQYKQLKRYKKRTQWGPFKGQRTLDDDEK